MFSFNQIKPYSQTEHPLLDMHLPIILPLLSQNFSLLSPPIQIRASRSFFRQQNHFSCLFSHNKRKIKNKIKIQKKRKRILRVFFEFFVVLLHLLLRSSSSFSFSHHRCSCLLSPSPFMRWRSSISSNLGWKR